MKWLACSLLVGLFGCVDSGTVVTEVELRVVGSGETQTTGRNGWAIELEEAQLAFGPLMFCPGRTAGEFCDTARGEWLDAVVVDALSPSSRRAGYVVATSGPALSWMYDYGFVSVLTQTAPLEMDAAAELGGNSALLRGCAHKEESRVCFTLAARVSQTTSTDRGVPVVRVSGLRGLDDLAGIQRMTAEFDARAWLNTIDFDAIVMQQQSLGGDCVPSCEGIELAPDSQAVRAVQTALGGSARPKLSWR